MINVTGKGLVVLTGCGHAGIVNICRYARRLTGDQPLYAAMGGFHLNGPMFEPLIPRVLDDLAEMAPQVLVPAHCTGWRAQHAMGRRFGEAFVPNTVGTRLTPLNLRSSGIRWSRSAWVGGGASWCSAWAAAWDPGGPEAG